MAFQCLIFCIEVKVMNSEFLPRRSESYSEILLGTFFSGGLLCPGKHDFFGCRPVLLGNFGNTGDTSTVLLLAQN